MLTISIGEIRTIVNIAIEKFNENEKYLIRNDVSERCICSKFATYLHIEIKNSTTLDGYDVDMEYNRGYNARNFEMKRINGSNVSLDLIVHKRGYNQITGFDNLICIEMKKTNNPKDYIDDEERLKYLTDCNSEFNYKIGYMIKIDLDTEKLSIKKQFVNELLNV